MIVELVRACIVLGCLVAAGRVAWKLVPDGPAKARTGRAAGGLGAGVKAVPSGFKSGAGDRWRKSVPDGAVAKKLRRNKAGRGLLVAGRVARGVGVAGAAGWAGTRAAWQAGQEAYRTHGQPQDTPQDTPGTGTGAVGGTPTGTAGRDTQDTPNGSGVPTVPGHPVLDTEEAIRARRGPTWNRMFPGPLSDKDRRFWTHRDGGYDGPIDQDGHPVHPEDWPFPRPARPDPEPGPIGVRDKQCSRCGQRPAVTVLYGAKVCADCLGAHVDQILNPQPTPTSTNGAPVPVPTELRTHTAVQDFAQRIDAMSEASDFMVVAEKARTVGEQSRAGGFGAEMDSAVDELEATARQFASAVDSLRGQAHKLAQTSMSVQGS